MGVIEFFQKHLSFRGRASRLTYWRYQLFDTFVAPLLIVGVIILDLQMNPAEDIHPATIVLVLAILIFTSISITAISVRRFHDLDMSGWNYLLLMVPFYGLYLSLVLGIKIGTDGPNRYGPDPRDPKPTRTLFPIRPAPTG